MSTRASSSGVAMHSASTLVSLDPSGSRPRAGPNSSRAVRRARTWSRRRARRSSPSRSATRLPTALVRFRRTDGMNCSTEMRRSTIHSASSCPPPTVAGRGCRAPHPRRTRRVSALGTDERERAGEGNDVVGPDEVALGGGERGATSVVWSRTTPFGVPVEPDVKLTMARASGPGPLPSTASAHGDRSSRRRTCEARRFTHAVRMRSRADHEAGAAAAMDSRHPLDRLGRVDRHQHRTRGHHAETRSPACRSRGR